MKFIIQWDVGFGTNQAEIEADSLEEAEAVAYEHWREDAENNANYEAYYEDEEYEDMS